MKKINLNPFTIEVQLKKLEKRQRELNRTLKQLERKWEEISSHSKKMMAS